VVGVTFDGSGQATFERYDPPEVEDPFDVIPGGPHHVVAMNEFYFIGFVPVDPAECRPCLNRQTYPHLGCVNGHQSRGMTDGDRAFCGVGGER